MRRAVTSHDGYVLLREDRSTCAQNWASRRGAVNFRQEKLKGSPVVVSVATAKVEGRRRSWTGAEGCPWDPSTRQTSRPGVRFHKLRFEELWCLQPPVRKVLAFMLCRLTDVRHAPSEPPAKRTLPDGDRRERVRSAAAARCAWLSWTAFPTKNSSLSIISYEKASQVFEEKELDKHSAVRSCQAGGSGEGEWSRRVTLHHVWVYNYILVHVYIGMPIKLFLYESQGEGGGGESKQILREYGFKKTLKITDDPLNGAEFTLFRCQKRCTLRNSLPSS